MKYTTKCSTVNNHTSFVIKKKFSIKFYSTVCFTNQITRNLANVAIIIMSYNIASYLIQPKKTGIQISGQIYTYNCC